MRTCLSALALYSASTIACTPAPWYYGAAADIYKHATAIVLARVNTVRTNRTESGIVTQDADVTLIEALKGDAAVSNVHRILRIPGLACGDEPFTAGETRLMVLLEDRGYLLEHGSFRQLMPPDEKLIPQLRAIRDKAP